jgi:hypothetical protein
VCAWARRLLGQPWSKHRSVALVAASRRRRPLVQLVLVQNMLRGPVRSKRESKNEATPLTGVGRSGAGMAATMWHADSTGPSDAVHDEPMSADLLLIDMDASYASVEQARRSDLRGRSWQRSASHAHVGSSSARC